MDPTIIAQGTVELAFPLSGLLALVAGILILVMPRILNYVVAFYLILVGIIQLFGLGA